MSNNNRDEFTDKTKLIIAKRAGWLCSDPSCRRPTVGSNSDGDGEINLGVAAHICAAAPGGPRYDHTMTSDERRSPNNGIWLCQLHSKAVDAEDSVFTVELLHEWNAQAQRDSWQRVLYNDITNCVVTQQLSKGDLTARLHDAASADLNIFRRSSKWPATAILLTLEVTGLESSVNARELATALMTLDDLILVSQPGMGKTTTLFQVAEAVLENENATPIVIQLGDWSVDGASLLESVLKRPAFNGISEVDFRSVAEKPGVILLLDGWNELDSPARKRASSQVAHLQVELPQLSLMISTRKQGLDVPVNGTQVKLRPLNESQQLSIARTLRGNEGENIINLAWHIAGVRELMTIPLYLTALLKLPDVAPFPDTKEEVIRRFVEAHEEDNQRTEALMEEMRGLHQRFLVNLAVTATQHANTSITETAARKSVSDTDTTLVTEGQITEKPDPISVLETLVSHHVLICAGEPVSFSFQHQQFQEWYASHFVEQLIIKSISDHDARESLRTDVLNKRTWEEAILFACERLASGNKQHQEACGAAILNAFDVDPALAAEMIYHSTDAVWACVCPLIQRLVSSWHVSGTVDKAVHFMISSGREEFFDYVWPLITHSNDQVHLTALRAGKRFRLSILGNNAAERLALLSQRLRQTILNEIVFQGGLDGFDLVATVAKADTVPEVKASVAGNLAFRRADRHVTHVLQDAEDKTFDLLAYNDLINKVTDETIKAKLVLARKRLSRQETPTYYQISSLVNGPCDEDRSEKLATVIAEMAISKKREGAVNLIYEAKKRFPHAVAKGILHRVREGLTLPFEAAELMAGTGFAFEDEALLNIALNTDHRFDNRANAAASVLGPKAIGRLVDSLFEQTELFQNSQGEYDKDADNRYHTIKERISYTQTVNLLAAVAEQSGKSNNQRLKELADLILRHPNGENGRGQPFDTNERVVIANFVEDWGNRLLASPDATRAELASIATLSCRSPSASLLPLLKRLLDEELDRWRTFKKQACIDRYQSGTATNEARMSWMFQYQRAFLANSCPETTKLMRDYLIDDDFGHSAALVLAEHWRSVNEPSDDKLWKSSPDFLRVAEKRATRIANPDASSEAADAIFCTIERLISPASTDAQKKHAVALAIVGAALPHGQRGDIIEALINIAEGSQLNDLLTNLVLSGEIVDVGLIKQGITDLLEAAQTQPWLLTEPYRLRNWLQLLPFSNRPSEILDIVQELPEQQRTQDLMEEMLKALRFVPGNDGENILFQLAESDSRLYQYRSWREVVFELGTLSSSTRLVNLVTQGVFNCEDGTDQWYTRTRLANLIREHSKLRAYVYDLLTKASSSPRTTLLAQAVAETPDEDGFFILIQLEIKHKRSYLSWPTIESLITKHVPIENFESTYNVLPVPATQLRRKLLAMTTDGGPTDTAAQYLNQIDEIRDHYGIPELEPRHPDLALGKAWPIIPAGPNTSETGGPPSKN